MELKSVEPLEEDIDALRFMAEATATKLAGIKLEKDYDDLEKIYSQMTNFLDLMEKIFGRDAEINDAEHTFIMEIRYPKGEGGHFSFFRILRGNQYAIDLHAFFNEQRREYGVYDKKYYKRGEKDPDDEEDERWAFTHRVISIKSYPFLKSPFVDDFMRDRLAFYQTVRTIGKIAKRMLRATDPG